MSIHGHLDPALERRLERLGLADNPGQWTERYLLCEQLVDPLAAVSRQKFDATSRFIRDLVAHRWVMTRRARERADPKRIHYLSLEFLLGRTLRNNVMNLAAEPIVRQAMLQQGWNLDELIEEEPDAGLGNGGLGRLAACFIDSLATLEYPAIGYGLRYEYGIFRQSIRDGMQVEQPDNWLFNTDPWEIPRPQKVYVVPLHATVELRGATVHFARDKPSSLLGMAYDRPVVGYGANCVNTLRLWAASAPQSFDLGGFSQGDFAGAVLERVAAESVTRVLYPDDSTEAGRVLRFLQQYFMVSCTLQDISARFCAGNADWSSFPDRVAVQMNDTHPALCVAELMRILLDQARLPWDAAWSITERTLSYTNHTLLPEALEKWPVDLFETLIPRQLEIIYEINRRFLDAVRTRHPGDEARVRRVSLIEEAPVRRVRMAHLAVVGSHSTNGVAAIHTDLLRSSVLRDFAQLYPERFNNKTNGVTPRRWLQRPIPGCHAHLRSHRRRLGEGRSPASPARSLRGRCRLPRRLSRRQTPGENRLRGWLGGTSGESIDPDTLVDSQVKRIHEYKRQLLNVLHVVMLHNRLRADPNHEPAPHTFLFAGKAAPAYHFAKLIIKLINNIAGVVNADPAARGRLKVLFLPEYNVSLAERLIPASDVSEQISTAGYEASGTGNMKFMMNGAVTIGTRDGATIEMAQEAGEENFFLFGLTAQQVADSAGWYDPHWHYANEPEIRAALDLIGSDHYSRSEPGIFAPILATLLEGGDHYRHLADLADYARTHTRLAASYADPEGWSRMAVLNVAGSGRFSSDRTISEYADQIWDLRPSPVV